MKFLQFLKWLIPPVLVGCGSLLIAAGHRYSFLGFVTCCVAGILVLYYLISALQRYHFMPAKILRTILSSLLCMGLMLVGVTEVLILHAGTAAPANGCSYIIVLGAKVNGTAPSTSLQERIETAAAYLQANPNTVAVLSGGQGEDEGISEAMCMYNALTQLGISGDRLWLEESSTSTLENLRFSLALIQDKTGSLPKQVGIVTNEFHQYRAGLMAGGLGTEPVPICAATGNLIIRINYTLRECAGVWKYVILGG